MITYDKLSKLSVWVKQASGILGGSKCSDMLTPETHIWLHVLALPIKVKQAFGIHGIFLHVLDHFAKVSSDMLENRKTGKPVNRETGKPVNRETGKPVNREIGKSVNR